MKKANSVVETQSEVFQKAGDETDVFGEKAMHRYDVALVGVKRLSLVEKTSATRAKIPSASDTRAARPCTRRRVCKMRYLI